MLALIIIPMRLLAQDPTPPDDIIEWASRFPEMIGSFWGLVVSVTLLVPVLLGLLKLSDANKVLKYLFTGVVTAVLTALAAILDFGYLHEAKVWAILLNGAFVFGAQIVGYAALKPLLDAIAEKFNFWKPTEPTP